VSELPNQRLIVSVAIQPQSDSDRDRLLHALRDLGQEDRTIGIATGRADGEMIISGVGELQLENICDRIVHEYKVALYVGQPHVIYLETIREKSEAEGKYVRGFSSRTLYAHVKIRLEPRERGAGSEFADETKDAAVPKEFVESVNLGIQEAMKSGVLAGYEMIDIRAVLYDGSYHVGDSNDMAFKIAGAMAFKEAARKASPVVLEPVMAIEVATSEEFVGAVVGDLASRRGRIEAMERRADSQVIRATVPLATMIEYAQHLRAIMQGRASYSMNFLQYEEVPRGGEPADMAGVTANTPKRPKAGKGLAAAQWDEES
jgi:elongation factor G